MIRARKREQARGERRNRRRGKQVGAGATLALGAGIAFAPAAQAAPFEVTNTNDAGAGSLRQAIVDANLDQTPDTISFAPGVTGTITLTTGDFDIDSPMTINGPGAANLTVSGDDTFRIFDIQDLDAPGPVTISGLTMLDGDASAGAAIRNVDTPVYSADLTVANSVLTSNETIDSGGAIYSDGGNLTIQNSTFTGNVADDDGNEYGGAMYVQDTRGGAGDNLVISNSTFAGNTADGDGGAAYFASLDGDFLIERSTISGNQAGDDGGGIVFRSEYTGSIGGRVDSTTISGNTAVNAAGGFWLLGLTGQLTVTDSTITGNAAEYGGGIANYQGADAALTIRNSTIARNSATDYGGGISRYASDDPAYPGADDVNLSSTIVALNSAPDGPDLSNEVPPVGDPPSGSVTVGFSLIGNTAGNVSLVQNPAGSNKLNVDPQLGAPANNGGPTQTLLPATTSPLVDAGIANGLTVDQRGLPRTVEQPLTPDAPGGDGTDIGSVEVEFQDEELTGAVVKAKRKQKQKQKVKVKLEAGADEDVTALATGKVRAGKKTYTLGQVSKPATAGGLAKLTLKPKKKKANKKIIKRLDAGKRAKANLTVMLTDASGNSDTLQAKVTLLKKKPKKK